MTKLKLATIDDNEPVKLTIALPAALHRNLIAYAEFLAKETGKTIEPAKLIAPMRGFIGCSSIKERPRDRW